MKLIFELLMTFSKTIGPAELAAGLGRAADAGFGDDGSFGGRTEDSCAHDTAAEAPAAQRQRITTVV